MISFAAFVVRFVEPHVCPDLYLPRVFRNSLFLSQDVALGIETQC